MEKRSKVLIVYFSGTGGTARAARAFENNLKIREIPLFIHSLDLSEFEKNKSGYPDIVNSSELIILLYAVYAMNAPLPVHEWIKYLPPAVNKKIAVISVSGGGEVWPNTSCRVKVKKLLKKKGYDPFYENMIVMPSNWIVSSGEHLSMHLLNILPEKTGKMLDAMLSGKERKSPFKLGTRILSVFGVFEKTGAGIFGKGLRAGDSCTSCGWCIKSCPMQNISIENGKPFFSNKCITCFRCIYGCPEKSVYATKAGFMVLKNGFNLTELEKRMKGIELPPITTCVKGKLFEGVKKYLLEND
jgi:ferredoxin/flavodoxin